MSGKQNPKFLSYEMLVEIRNRRILSKSYQDLKFNDRFEEPLHVLKTNHNCHDHGFLCKETIDHYIPYWHLCWICSVTSQPRDNLCGCEDVEKFCNFYVHSRGSKGIPDAPVVECKTSLKDPLTIKLSRANMSVIIDLELSFMFRSSSILKCAMDHEVDYFWDRPGSVKIVTETWHKERHPKKRACEQRIETLRKCIARETDSVKRDIFVVKLRLEDDLLSKLSKVEHDPQLLRLIYEIDERVKLTRATGNYNYMNSIPLVPEKKLTKPEKRLMEILEDEFLGEFKFIGNCDEFVGSKNPDFVHKKTGKYVEMFGNFVHGNIVTGMSEDLHEKDRIIGFNEFGHDVQIVWESELEDVEQLKKKLREFIYGS